MHSSALRFLSEQLNAVRVRSVQHFPLLSRHQLDFLRERRDGCHSEENLPRTILKRIAAVVPEISSVTRDRVGLAPGSTYARCVSPWLHPYQRRPWRIRGQDQCASSPSITHACYHGCVMVCPVAYHVYASSPRESDASFRFIREREGEMLTRYRMPVEAMYEHNRPFRLCRPVLVSTAEPIPRFRIQIDMLFLSGRRRFQCSISHGFCLSENCTIVRRSQSLCAWTGRSRQTRDPSRDFSALQTTPLSTPWLRWSNYHKLAFSMRQAQGTSQQVRYEQPHDQASGRLRTWYLEHIDAPPAWPIVTRPDRPLSCVPFSVNLPWRRCILCPRHTAKLSFPTTAHVPGNRRPNAECWHAYMGSGPIGVFFGRALRASYRHTCTFTDAALRMVHLVPLRSRYTALSTVWVAQSGLHSIRPHPTL